MREFATDQQAFPKNKTSTHIYVNVLPSENVFFCIYITRFKKTNKYHKFWFFIMRNTK